MTTENAQKRGFAKFPELGIAVMKLMDILVTIYKEEQSETGAETRLMDAMVEAIDRYEKETLPESKRKEPA